MLLPNTYIFVVFKLFLNDTEFNDIEVFVGKCIILMWDYAANGTFCIALMLIVFFGIIFFYDISFL